MILKIKSRKLNKTITFSRPGTRYIFADLNGKEGTLGMQICFNSNSQGGYSTIAYSGGSQEEFEAICRKWYRRYIANR